MSSIRTWARARWDSWLNVLTGVGGSLSKTAFAYAAPPRVDDQTLEAMFYGDAFAARVCALLPREALRQGFTVKTEDAAVTSALAARLDDLGAKAKLVEAWTWARRDGGAALFVGADDGRDPAEPLDWAAIRAVHFLTVLEKRELQVDTSVTAPLDRRFGEPEVYRFQRVPAAGGGVDARRVHVSRLIRFDGAMTGRGRRAQNGGWGESELARVLEELRQFRGAWAGAGTLLQEASQGVFKIKDLMRMMAEDADDDVKKRLEVMDLSRSLGRAILIDADGEDYSRVESSAFAGVPDVLDRFMLYLAGASEIPVTLLMGRSPAGLNATGESDIRGWYDRVKSAQADVVRPRLERLVRMILRSADGPTGGVEPPEWSVEFAPLWQSTPHEDAQLRNQVAQTDAIYLDKGVLTPEEVALSRFRAEGWSAETSVDLEAREKALAADQAAAVLPEPTPVEPPAPPVATPPPDARLNGGAT